MGRPYIGLAVAVVLVVAACGDSGEPTTTAGPVTTVGVTTLPPPTTTTVARTTTTPPVPTPTTTTAPATTTTVAGPAIEIGEPDSSGVITVTIDGDRLAPLFNSFTPGDDPFYLVHTQQDDVFVGVEMYTVFGAGWTGELGTFPADCTTHGLCVYLDPDGVGPLPGFGPGTGTITVMQLEGGTVVSIDDVAFTADDGQVYRLAGLTLTA